VYNGLDGWAWSNKGVRILKSHCSFVYIVQLLTTCVWSGSVSNTLLAPQGLWLFERRS